MTFPVFAGEKNSVIVVSPIPVIRALVSVGCDWSGITGSQVYTVHDFRPVLENLFAELGISQIGVAWYPGWPPVSDMEFEVDVRRVRTELVI